MTSRRPSLSDKKDKCNLVVTCLKFWTKNDSLADDPVRDLKNAFPIQFVARPNYGPLAVYRGG